MANYVIVGGGASGLYTAYRLLTGGTLKQGEDTVNIYEWSDRLGGRIYTYTFPEDISSDGLYVEVGGMRFATDSNFPNSIVEGHVLVQNMVVEMNLQDKVLPFIESPERMYYLRGKNFYENGLTDVSKLPYNFNAEFLAFLKNAKVASPYTADNILAAIAGVFAPGQGGQNANRPSWCDYYAGGTVDQAAATTSFPQGTGIRDIGYWNLLYDQLGDEGYDYAADGNGYTSNVINWNSADAMQANNDYGSGVNYNRLDGGYSILFQALAQAITGLMANFPGSAIWTQQQLVSLAESNDQTVCVFNDLVSGNPNTVHADNLFLAMPRRSLEIVAANSPGYALGNEQVQFYLESSLDQPAIKAVMVFDTAWYTNAPEAPELTNGVGGPTITDLPLRQVYYFGNNVPGSPNNATGPFVLLASYDDMNYSNFWRQLEVQGDYTEAPSQYRQPLTGPTNVPVGSPFANLLIKQLAEAHGMTADQVPQPIAILFQDWGQDPFGGGYHGWSAHYNICQAMDYVRAPYQKILNRQSPNLYIIGSCYSFDQAWVEGAFCTAESVLQDFFDLQPFRGVTNYQLICTASNT
jgi:hypothetical protein